MEIRKADAHDYPQLIQLYTELDELHQKALPGVFRQPNGPLRSLEYFKKVISDSNSIVFVAQKDAELIGFVHAYVRQSPDVPILVPRKFGIIEDLLVTKDSRKKGVGQQLMEKARQWILDQGADLIELNVWEFNTQARTFYEKLGYQTVSRKMWKWL